MSNRKATITAIFTLVGIIIGLTSYICEAGQKIATQSELIDVLLKTPEEEWEPILKEHRELINEDWIRKLTKQSKDEREHGRLKAALERAFIAYRMSQLYDKEILQADSAFETASTLHHRGFFLEAKKYYALARELYEKSGNRRGEASANVSLAKIEFYLDDSNVTNYQQPLQSAMNLLKYIEDEEERKVILAKIHKLEGNILALRGEFEQSTKKFNEAIALLGETNEKEVSVILLLVGDNELMDIEREGNPQERKASARKKYEAAKSLSQQIGDRSGEARAIMKIGDCY